MIWATGDCHGNFQRFGMKYFPEQKGMDRDDYMIVFVKWRMSTPQQELTVSNSKTTHKR